MSKWISTTLGYGVRIEEWPAKLQDHFYEKGLYNRESIAEHLREKHKVTLQYLDDYGLDVDEDAYCPCWLLLNKHLQVGTREMKFSHHDIYDEIFYECFPLLRFLRECGVYDPSSGWVVVAEYN